MKEYKLKKKNIQRSPIEFMNVVYDYFNNKKPVLK